MDLVNDARNSFIRTIVSIVGVYATTLRSFEVFVMQFEELADADVDVEISSYRGAALEVLGAVKDGITYGDDASDTRPDKITACLHQMQAAVAGIDKAIPCSTNPAAPAAETNLSELRSLLVVLQGLVTSYVVFVGSDPEAIKLAADAVTSIERTAADAVDPSGVYANTTLTADAAEITRRYVAMLEEGIEPCDAFAAAMTERIAAA